MPTHEAAWRRWLLQHHAPAFEPRNRPVALRVGDARPSRDQRARGNRGPSGNIEYLIFHQGAQQVPAQKVK